MPLEWTHDDIFCPQGAKCPGDTSCKSFPSILDRRAMAHAAYCEYAESDGTSFLDFIRDVLILALTENEDLPQFSVKELKAEVSKAWQDIKTDTLQRRAPK